MTIVALFGPPAAGKSTLIQEAKRMGVEAYDIEELGHSYTERKQAFTQLLPTIAAPYVLFGAADLRMHDFPAGTIFIALLPPLGVYTERLKHRDNEHPHKAGQDALVHYQHFVDRLPSYDHVFTQVAAIGTLLREILDNTHYQQSV